jgi:predicted TIM-barrel enzyme
MATAGEETPEDKPKKSVRPKLGQGRQRGSGVRQLNKADLDQLRAMYATAGIALMPFNAGAAIALTEGADECVDAWDELAKQNDSVRRALLAMIEGGAWSRVFMAHVPIILTFIPGHIRNMLPLEEPQQEQQETGEQ